jgi:hypothetical protein
MELVRLPFISHVHFAVTGFMSRIGVYAVIVARESAFKQMRFKE